MEISQDKHLDPALFGKPNKWIIKKIWVFVNADQL